MHCVERVQVARKVGSWFEPNKYNRHLCISRFFDLEYAEIQEEEDKAVLVSSFFLSLFSSVSLSPPLEINKYNLTSVSVCAGTLES